ncbi:NAD(P)/FAD-dependent oxidoreductase [Streptomyces sp. NPDC050704]|uniref:flavin monoamine oxidase family protein n=1 Tax=Streptomyces sp. NPDC050704 TaxID=3157219 RepID=UPI00343CACBA
MSLIPDFPFDYAAYVSRGRAVGRLPEDLVGRVRVAVIGAGAAGLCAAYELMRIGVVPVIYEAERDPAGPGGYRLGGRLRSVSWGGGPAVAELGAMRFSSGGRLMRHYVRSFGLTYRPFPDPFTTGAPRTVLDLDGRQYQAGTQAELFEQKPEFGDVQQAWEKLLHNVGVHAVREQLADGDLVGAKEHWNRVLDLCEGWSFRRLLTDPQTGTMTPQQVDLFGVMGFGTGGWDAFYAMAAPEILRIMISGMEQDQQLIVEGASELPRRFWTTPVRRADGSEVSLASLNDQRLRGPVTRLAAHASTRSVTVDDGQEAVTYPAVVLTPQPHAVEAGIELGGHTALFGPRLRRALRRTTSWASAKTVSLVDEPFWRGTSLDGVTLSDSLIRDTYALDYAQYHPGSDTAGHRAALVLSYTWGEHALNLSSSSLAERVALGVSELSRIHPEVADELRRQIRVDNTVTASWELELNFRGLCNFNTPGEYGPQRDRFSHFMKDYLGEPAVPGEPMNNLFLAGDAICWSGAWVEHALGSGLNAAWGVLRALGGSTAPDNPGPGDVWADPRYTPCALD